MRGPVKVIRPPARRTATTSCMIPGKMLDGVTTAMRRQGISSRRRSRWIDDAIGRLLDQPGHMDLIAEGFLEHRTSVLISLTLRGATRRRIDDLLAEAPATFRGRVDVSTVVRAAITRRIIEDS